MHKLLQNVHTSVMYLESLGRLRCGEFLSEKLDDKCHKIGAQDGHSVHCELMTYY
jgi:hypothetical protein